MSEEVSTLRSKNQTVLTSDRIMPSVENLNDKKASCEHYDDNDGDNIQCEQNDHSMLSPSLDFLSHDQKVVLVHAW